MPRMKPSAPTTKSKTANGWKLDCGKLACELALPVAAVYLKKFLRLTRIQQRPAALTAIFQQANPFYGFSMAWLFLEMAYDMQRNLSIVNKGVI